MPVFPAILRSSKFVGERNDDGHSGGDGGGGGGRSAVELLGRDHFYSPATATGRPFPYALIFRAPCPGRHFLYTNQKYVFMS